MAERGDFHPFRRDRPSYNRNLSRNDVGNQGRQLLLRFINDRMQADGITNAPAQEMLVDPQTPSGPPVERVAEVAAALRRIGDELDGDPKLQKLIAKIPPDAPQQTFLNVAKEIFADGQFNWGRVTMLFYFAYKMIVKIIYSLLDQVPLMRSIIEWVVNYIVDYLAPAIIDRGGWEAVMEYFGTPAHQALGVLVTGFIISVSIYLWKTYR